MRGTRIGTSIANPFRTVCRTHFFSQPPFNTGSLFRQNEPQLDARVAARAARKEEVGRLAESLAEDAKLIAARHQHAARRMEVLLPQFAVGELIHERVCVSDRFSDYK